MIDVLNSEVLVERFGQWPSFHDAEVIALRLDSGQRTTGRPSLDMDIHVFAVGRPASGSVGFEKHTLVTLRFEGAADIELDGFGPQNVLDELVFEDLGPAWADRIRVSMPSNNGMAGGFTCAVAMVIAVEPFVPGEHSVYGRAVE